MHNCKANPSTLPSEGEIWLLLDSLTFGGIETHVVELAAGLLNHGQAVRVVLVAKYDQESAIIAKLCERNIPYHYLPQLNLLSLNISDSHSLQSGEQNAKRSVFAHSALKQAIKAWRPSVIHAHGYKASIISKLACIGSQCHQISTYHAGEAPVGKVRWYDLADRYSAWLSKHTIAVSAAIGQKIPSTSIVMDNFLTLPSTPSNDCQLNDIRVSHHKKLSIGFVGRLSYEKAPDRFITLARQFPEHEFIIFGDGDMRDTLEHDAPSNVLFRGFVTDMSSIWPEIDILLLTSRYEGLPMTAIEAMANHTLVISMNVGAISSLIESEKNGWVVDSMEEMKALITNFGTLELSTKASLLTQAYQTIVCRFSDKAVIPKILTLYRT